MKYDAILVLGRGINADGSIPASVDPTINKAISLYKQGQSKQIIFSGRWTYHIDYTPPQTEANAMAVFAKKLGLPDEAICLEESSYTTVTNAYFIKKNFLIPNNWRQTVLVSIYPMSTRAHYVLQYVFGPNYRCDLVVADYRFSPDKLKEKEKREKEKLVHAKSFYKENNLAPGDHETIFRVTGADLHQNWIKK